jgi:hypothetical protein
MSLSISPAPHQVVPGKPFPRTSGGKTVLKVSLNAAALGTLGESGLSSPPRIPQNPFAFRVGDASMKKENAVQYYPPHKRMEIREYLSRSSVKFK